MKCTNCQTSKIRKYGFKNHKQKDIQCKQCGRIFQSRYSERGYSDDVQQICLKMYLNGLEFRAIERITSIHHTTVINAELFIRRLDEHAAQGIRASGPPKWTA